MIRYGRRGFTLIEMLIVIVVIAILAGFVIVGASSSVRREKVAALHSNLLLLRNAIQRFEADCVGYPKDLNELMVKPADLPCGVVIVGDTKPYVVTWQGPYLKTPDGKLPVDPFTLKADWNYDPGAGKVHSSSTRHAINGEFYSEW